MTRGSSPGMTPRQRAARTVLTVVGVRRAVARQGWAPPAALLLLVMLEIWMPGLALLEGPNWVFACVALAAAVALVWRRRQPLLCFVLVGVSLAAPLPFCWVTQSTAMVLMLVVALFACGRYGRRPLAYLSVPIAAGLVIVKSFPDPEQEPADTWGWSLNTTLVFALGAAFRHERALRDRAAEATEARA